MRIPPEKLKVKLPPGFYLEEEGDDFVHLFSDKNEHIGVFTKSGNPREIEWTARRWKEKFQKKKD